MDFDCQDVHLNYNLYSVALICLINCFMKTVIWTTTKMVIIQIESQWKTPFCRWNTRCEWMVFQILKNATIFSKKKKNKQTKRKKQKKQQLENTFCLLRSTFSVFLLFYAEIIYVMFVLLYCSAHWSTFFVNPLYAC